MTKILNRVGMLCSTAGQGTITVTVPISNKFLTPPEAGAVDGEQYFFVLEEGNDFEIFKGTVGSSGTTITRDEVIASKIGGVAGTTKMTLAGGATLRSALPKEGVAQGWTLIESITASSGTEKIFDNIPDAYHDLMIIGQDLDLASGSTEVDIRFSVDNGSNYTGSIVVQDLSSAGGGVVHLTILGCQLPLPLLISVYNGTIKSVSLASASRINALKISVGSSSFTGSGTLKLYGR